MKTSIIILLFMAFSMNVHSQFDPNKLKNKAKNKVENSVNDKKKEQEKNKKAQEEVNETNDSKVQEGDKETVSEATEIRNSPAKEQIGTLDTEISLMKRDVDSYLSAKGMYSSCRDCDLKFEKVRIGIERVRQIDPDFSGLHNREELVADYEKKYLAKQEGVNLRFALSQIDDKIERLNKEPYYYDRYTDDLSRRKYDSIVAHIDTSALDNSAKLEISNLRKNIDAFYNKDALEVIPYLEKDVNDNYIEASFWSDNNRVTDAFWEKLTSKKDVRNDIDNLNKTIFSIKSVVGVLPDNQELNSLLANHSELKGQLDRFLSSGEFDKLIAKKREEEIAAKRMSKPGMTNTALINIIKDGIKKDLEEGQLFKRAVIVDNTWYVEKNGLGVPINKRVNVEVAISLPDGNCYVTDGYIIKTYEGGGNYGPAHFNWHGLSYDLEKNLTGQILCVNVFK